MLLGLYFSNQFQAQLPTQLLKIDWTPLVGFCGDLQAFEAKVNDLAERALLRGKWAAF